MEHTSHKFGPIIFQYEIDDKVFLQKILFEGKNMNIKMNEFLAGQIEDEFQFTYDLRQEIENKLNPYIHDYIDKLNNSKGGYDIKNYKPSITDCWVNIQKKNEVNPPHNHSGHISFVFYVQVPEEIKNEINKTKSFDPGSINFMYSHGNDFRDISNKFNDNVNNILRPTTVKSFIPYEGLLFIFPAYLSHYVEPFKSDNVERISIAGNYIIIDSTKKGII